MEQRSKDILRAKHRRLPRVVVLVVIGVVLIAGGLAVRGSRWARERRLRNMTVEDLAFEARDHSSDALTFGYYGGALFRAGQLRDSEAAYRRAIQLDPTYEDARTGLAGLLMQENRLHEAYEEFKAATENDPRDPEAFIGLAQTVHMAGSAASTIKPLKRVVELLPHSAQAWYELGRMYGETSQWDRSYDAIKHAATLAPKQPDYWRDMGQISLHYGRLDVAERELKTAARLKYDPATLYLLGTLYCQRGDDPKNRGYAEAALSHAIARDPQMGAAYLELGRLYEREGSYALAIHNLREAARLTPEDDKPLYHLGMCLLRTGKTAEGQKLLKASHDLAAARNEISDLRNRSIANPGDRTLHLRLARLYSKLDYPDGAIPEYRAYLSAGPPDPVVMKEADACRAALARKSNPPQPHAPKPHAPSP